MVQEGFVGHLSAQIIVFRADMALEQQFDMVCSFNYQVSFPLARTTRKLANIFIKRLRG